MTSQIAIFPSPLLSEQINRLHPTVSSQETNTSVGLCLLRDAITGDTLTNVMNLQGKSALVSEYRNLKHHVGFHLSQDASVSLAFCAERPKLDTVY